MEVEESDQRTSYLYCDDGVPTHTSVEQKKLEYKLKPYYATYSSLDTLKFKKEAHISYLLKGLKGLNQGYQSLDASKPWLCYWIIHSLTLLEYNLPTNICKNAVDYLSRCQNKSGGFAGGPGQLSHLAPTYAAVNALVSLGTEEAFNMIDREKMYKFLLSVKDKATSGFVMHEDGEIDVRGSYCALSVATLLNIVTPELTAGMAEFIGRCQTYEGGLGGYPGNEAHGGYTFCGVAALLLLNRTDVINVPRLLEWAVQRQMGYEGGFQGRTNKLVDACYSFWQGGLFPLIDSIIQHKPTSDWSGFSTDGSWLFSQQRLQEYVLLCCQESSGGIKDKPGKSKDYYHTCYGLSGLSVCQHNRSDFNSEAVKPVADRVVARTHPIFNVRIDKVDNALNYFRSLKPIS